MAMTIITGECFACSACVYVCPREAISEAIDDRGALIYLVDPGGCTECRDEGGPRCRDECPVPECIVRVVDDA